MKNKMYLIIAVATLIAFTVAGTYAFFQVIGGTTESKNVNVQTYTTDLFTTNVTDEILLTADQSDFYQNAGNKTATTTASARLVPNSKSGTVTEHYNVYVVIDTNNFIYTTQNHTAEIILTITDPTGNPAGSITGLNSVTPGVFDITTRTGAFKVVEDYEISTNNPSGTTQEWQMTVTLVNLDTDQNDNTGKTLTGTIYITKENLETYSLAQLNGIRTSHINEQTGEVESNIGSTSVTVEAQTTAGSEGVGAYFFGIEETSSQTGYLKTENQIVNGIEYFESEEPTYTFTNLKDETEYTVYSFVEDRAGFKSNIYTTSITTIEYILPTVDNAVTQVLDLHRIKVTATSSAGENPISKYLFDCGDSSGWSIPQDSNEYVCTGLTYNTNYNIKVKVLDSYGKYSTEYVVPSEISNFEITCSAGEYLAANSEVCVTCPAGSYCPGGTYVYDELAHGSNLCVAGSYSIGGASSCTACAGGTTNSGTGNSSACTTTCSNNSQVASWKTSTWNSDNTVSNLCAANTCNTNYKVSGNDCIMAYRCTSGTLTADATKGASSGGYVCVTNGSGTRSCKNNNYKCNYTAETLFACDNSGNTRLINKPALTNQSPVLYGSVGQNCSNGTWGCQFDVEVYSSDPGFTSYSKIIGNSDYENIPSISKQTSSAGLVYYTQCTYVYSSGNTSCSQSTANIATFESRQASLPSNQSVYAYMGYVSQYIYQNEYYGVKTRYTCAITYTSSELGACAPYYRIGTITCPDGEITTYKCPGGWSSYTSDSSKCYRAATTG